MVVLDGYVWVYLFVFYLIGVQLRFWAWCLLVFVSFGLFVVLALCVALFGVLYLVVLLCWFWFVMVVCLMGIWIWVLYVVLFICYCLVGWLAGWLDLFFGYFVWLCLIRMDYCWLGGLFETRWFLFGLVELVVLVNGVDCTSLFDCGYFRVVFCGFLVCLDAFCGFCLRGEQLIVV